MVESLKIQQVQVGPGVQQVINRTLQAGEPCVILRGEADEKGRFIPRERVSIRQAVVEIKAGQKPQEIIQSF